MMILESFLNNFCSVSGCFVLLKRKMPIGNTVAMKWLTWSAVMFKQMACDNVAQTWMQEPKVSQENIAFCITMHPTASAGLAYSTTAPCRHLFSSDAHNIMWKKCDSSDQAFHCSMIQFWSSNASWRCFQHWTGVTDTLISLWQCRPILYAASCDALCARKPAWTFSAIHITDALLYDPTSWISLHFPWRHDHRLSFLAPLLIL